MQRYVKFRNYAIKIKRTKSYKKFIFNKLNYLYIIYNKENKIIELKITKRVYETF